MKVIFFAFALTFFSTLAAAQTGWRYIGPVDREIQAMAVHEDLILCAASTTGGDRLFRSTDAGQTWDTLASGVRNIAIIPDGIPTIVGSIPPNKDFLISTDLGDTWDTTGTPPPGIWLSRIYIKEDTPGLIFAIAGPSSFRYERLYRSTDYGRSWTYAYNFPASSDGSNIAVGISPNTPDVYVNVDTDIGGQYFYHSSDDGVTWEFVTHGRFITQMMVDPDNQTNIYASIIGGIYQSNDGGFSWTQIHSGVSIIQDKMNPNLLFSVGRPTGTQPGVTVSENRGKTWWHDSATLNLPFKQIIDPYNPNVWLQYEPGRKRLYLQTMTGIYMRENFLTAVLDVEIASNTFLHAYPQPAQKYLRITTGQPKSAMISLRVYTTVGRVLRHWMLDTERYISWDLTDGNATQIQSGVYLLVMQEGATILSKTIIIQR